MLLAVAMWTLAQQQADAARDLLVLYLYSSADSQYATNLNYFVKEAIEKDTRTDFYVLVPKKVKQVPTSSVVVMLTRPARSSSRAGAASPCLILPPA